MKKILFLIPILVSLASVAFLQLKETRKYYSDGITFGFNERIPVFDKNMAELLSFGYSHAYAMSIWLRFLQFTPVNPVPEGQISWIYYDLDSITSIDPDFKPAYEHGGLFLAVITTDKIGAEKFLLKGISSFPKNWRLHAYLGYLYEIELGDSLKAGPHYLAAANIEGSAKILSLLAARYLAKTESAERAIVFLEELLKNTKDVEVRKRILERIKMWKEKGVAKK